MEQENETIDLREVFYLLWHNVILIAFVTVLCAAVGFCIVKFAVTPQYQADSTLIVNTRQDVTANVTNDQLSSAKQLVNIYNIIVKSDTVLEQVIQTLKLDMSYEDLNALVAVTAVDATQVMQVSVKHADQAFAIKVLQEIVKIVPDIIKEKVEVGSVKVVSEPRLRDGPVYPNKMSFTAIAALLGFVACVGFLFIKEMLNNNYHNDNDIQKNLGLPLLGVIPELSQENK